MRTAFTFIRRALGVVALIAILVIDGYLDDHPESLSRIKDDHSWLFTQSATAYAVSIALFALMMFAPELRKLWRRHKADKRMGE